MNSRYLIGQIVADGGYLVRIRGSHHHFRHTSKPGGGDDPSSEKGPAEKDRHQYFETGAADVIPSSSA